MPHAKRDVMLQYTHIIQHHFKPTEYSADKPMPQSHMQNVTPCHNILLILSSVLWKCKMPLQLNFMLLVCESMGQFRSNITGIFLTELKIKLLSISQSFVCNMISRCENKIGVAWPLLGLRATRCCMLSAQQQAHLAVETCLQNLVQVGKQSFVFKDNIEFQWTQRFV